MMKKYKNQIEIVIFADVNPRSSIIKDLLKKGEISRTTHAHTEPKAKKPRR